MTVAPTSACLLLVEGDDDKHVVEHLVRIQSAMPGFETQTKGGFDNVVAAIGPEINVSGRRALGILVDANEDPRARWRLLREILKDKGIGTPSGPKANGIVLAGKPQIGIWMMPDNNSPGELENFIEKLIPPKDPVWAMACNFIDAIPESQRKFSDNKQVKAKVRAWLATRARPRHMGEAIGKGDLSSNEPIALALVDWLRKVFTI